MKPDTAADLHTEIRRLRIRIAGLSGDELDAGRRTEIRSALSALSALSADGRPVPALADRVLGDQLVVLLQDCLPEYGAAPAVTARALQIAVELRRHLA
ncbi:hypothetical protein AB0I45_11115 [Brevibacterium sp. NPDC049920]|uniref:Uncharacterized protein n=2 Tax=Brevibacterium TaxID=1696 RepID=A0ABP8JNG4_9MICO